MRTAKEMSQFLRDTYGYHATRVLSDDLMECADILDAQQQEIEHLKVLIGEHTTGLNCRCKDCKFSAKDTLSGLILYCYFWKFEDGMSPNRVDELGFCSNGERR